MGRKKEFPKEDDCPDEMQPCKCGCEIYDAMVVIDGEWICASCIGKKINRLENLLDIYQSRET